MRLVLWLLLLGSLCWGEPFTCPEGRFVADLTPAAERSIESSDSPLGAISTVIYLDRLKGRYLTVSYTDLPKLALLGGRERIFQEACQSLLSSCQGELQDCQVIDRSTRSLRYRVGDSYLGRALLRLEQFRLYVVDARSEAPLAQDNDRFLHSFRVLPRTP